MSELLDPIIEETSHINSVTTSPAHEYLEVINNGSDTVGCKFILLPFSQASPVKREPVVHVNAQRHAGSTFVEPEQKGDLHPNATAKDSLSHTSLRSKESYDNLSLGGTTIMGEPESVTESPSIKMLEDITGTLTNNTVENKIKSVINSSKQTTKLNEVAKYDPELKEYMESAFNTLTSLVNGICVGPENWVLLLTKAMYVVSLIKTLDADKKIRLSVDLVIRYLDDYTTLEDSILVGIKSSVHSMCISILNNSGTLTNNTTKAAVITGDPDVLATPLQITDLVIKKLINLVKSREIDIQGIKTIFPELVVLCITTVEKYPHFTGLEKKNLVIQIIQRFMSEYIPLAFTVSHDEKQGLTVLSQSLPFLVDTLVNVGRGKVNYKFDFSNPETLSKLQLLGICLLSCIKRRPNTL